MEIHQEKLKEFIANIPAMPGQIPSGPTTKPPYSDDLNKKLAMLDTEPGKYGKELEAGYPTNKHFKDYTGRHHYDLMKNWSTGGMMTTCNEFVGKCSFAMGSKLNLGRFDLKDFLQTSGKGHAWVPANSGKRPEYGDIFRPVKFHMGVSLGFEGDDWLTVESGQGGPSTGFDIIKRKRQKFDPNSLQGWCNMKVFLDPRPATPDWLKGTWLIYWIDKIYTYHFNETYEAFYYPWIPPGNDPRTAIPTDTGKVDFIGSSDTFNLTWKNGGEIEKFTYDRWESFPGMIERISGTTIRGEPLKGIRL